MREVRLRIILLSIYRCIACGLYLDACRVHLYPAFVRRGGGVWACVPAYIRARVYACVSEEETPSSANFPSPFLPKMKL